MKKKQVFMSLAVLAVVVAAGMYIIGGDSGNLTELRDLFWVPLPLAVVLYLVGMKSSD
jgi:hypothetical protein